MLLGQLDVTDRHSAVAERSFMHGETAVTLGDVLVLLASHGVLLIEASSRQYRLPFGLAP